MRHPALPLAVLLLTFLAVSPTPGQSPPVERVRKAVTAQDAWLAPQRYGPGWNLYLMTSQLKQQLAKGASADAAVVQRVLSRYDAPEPGLDLPKFTSTRKALTAWSNELGQPDTAKLLEMVRGAKGSFKPVPKADVLSRQVATEAAVRRLDRYLRNSGANGEGWREYLQMDKLQAEVKKGLDARPDSLKAYRARFVNGLDGQELPQFTGVAKSLQRYAGLLAGYQNAEAQAQYQSDLDALAGYLETAQQKPGELDRRALAEVVGRLTASGQASELMSLVRRRFAEPNLRVQVSDYIVTAGIADDIDEDTPIRDVILGTQISGRGRTRGVVGAALVPNDDRAQVEITLRGTTTSKNVGHNGPATIFTSASTSLLARKEVFIDAAGFSSTPACAECDTDNHIDSICIDGGRLITRIATKRVYASKDTAAAIASDHAETRVEKRVNTKTGDLLTNANRTYNDRFRNPLMRRAAFPQEFDFSTSADWLTVVGLQARPGELGASTSPPEMAADVQLSVRAHESLIENMAEVMLAGRTARDEDFKRLVRNVDGRKLSQEDFKILLRNLRDGVETHKDFSGLLKDRLERTITPADFDALVRAINEKQLSESQYSDYLRPLMAEPVATDQADAMLQELPDPSQGSLTFAEERPVSIRFRDDAVTITLHSTGHSSRTGVERQIPMDISASYKFEWRGGKLVSQRQGEIEVSPPGFKPGDSLDVQQTAARRTLRTRFEEIFKPEMESTGLTLRGRWKKLGELPWAQMTVKDGWIAAGWKVSEGQNAAE